MKTILIADDEPEILELYLEALSDIKDIRVISAVDGAEAYSKSRNQVFDLIITDYRMPKLNGVQFVAALRANPINSTCPIYIITGYAHEVAEELKRERLSANLKVVEKPVQLDFIQLIAQTPEISTPKLEKKKSQTSKEKTSVSIDVNFVNPYIESVSETLKTFTRVKFIQHLKPFLFNQQNELLVDISSMLNIESASFTGNLILGFPKETFLKTATEILCLKQSDFSHENKNIIAELNNIIFKKCKNKWDDLDFQFDRATPSVVFGKKHHLEVTNEHLTIVIPFVTNYGTLLALICVENKEK